MNMLQKNDIPEPDGGQGRDLACPEAGVFCRGRMPKGSDKEEDFYD